MSRSRKIFLACALIYLLIVAAVSFDISRKTTFPGSKPQLRERIENKFTKPDSARKDSIFP